MSIRRLSRHGSGAEGTQPLGRQGRMSSCLGVWGPHACLVPWKLITPSWARKHVQDQDAVTGALPWDTKPFFKITFAVTGRCSGLLPPVLPGNLQAAAGHWSWSIPRG